MVLSASSDVDNLRVTPGFEDEDFLAGEFQVEVQPLFSSGEPLRFISQECGPFDRRSNISIPLWVALYLEKHGKCIIQTPDWLSPQALKRKLREEREAGAGSFAELPDHLIQVAFMLLSRNYLQSDYLGGSSARNQMETILTELLLLRRAKIAEGLKQVDVATTVVGISNMTSAERECIRPQTSVILDSLRDMWTIKDNLSGVGSGGL